MASPYKYQSPHSPYLPYNQTCGFSLPALSRLLGDFIPCLPGTKIREAELSQIKRNDIRYSAQECKRVVMPRRSQNGAATGGPSLIKLEDPDVRHPSISGRVYNGDSVR